MNGDPDPIYVSARRTLLDALEFLGVHREAVILVGAQAIYLHARDAGLPVAPFTKDADLVLNPKTLGPEPRIDDILRSNGYSPDKDWPGIWRNETSGGQIDFLVPEALAGSGRRSADLKAQGKKLAHRARGLEGVLVDNAPMTIGALEPTDSRSFTIAVAGPSALLVSKLWKLGERDETKPRHLNNKDALDVLRLLQRIAVGELMDGLQRQFADGEAGTIGWLAMAYLRELFGTPEAKGAQLAAAAVEGLADPMTIRLACAALANELLGALDSEGQ